MYTHAYSHSTRRRCRWNEKQNHGTTKLEGILAISLFSFVGFMSCGTHPRGGPASAGALVPSPHSKIPVTPSHFSPEHLKTLSPSPNSLVFPVAHPKNTDGGATDLQRWNLLNHHYDTPLLPAKPHTAPVSWEIETASSVATLIFPARISPFTAKVRLQTNLNCFLMVFWVRFLWASFPYMDCWKWLCHIKLQKTPFGIKCSYFIFYCNLLIL